jgi:thiosulfate/3-mercaptopyruvate sulfurtransferase
LFVIALFSMIGIILQGCSTQTTSNKEDETSSTYPNKDLLVDAVWVEEHLDDENIRFVDLRAEGFEGGHIPDAVNITWQELTDPNNKVDGFLLPVDEFEEKMRSLGINNETTVVAYDDGTSLSAARLFYALEYYGHYNVKVLNSGFTGWLDAGKEVSTVEPSIDEGSFTAKPQEERVSSLEFVANNLENEDVVIVDTRSSAEYSGEDVRADRGGHIPNAVHLEWKESITEKDGIPTFKSVEELMSMFEEAGIVKEKMIVPYCQTNVRGAHTYFTLRLLGFDEVKPYEGSWSEWGNNSSVSIDN